MHNENFALRLEDLVVRYGAGRECRGEPESAAACMEQRCGLSMIAGALRFWSIPFNTIQWIFFPARFHGR